MQPGPGLHFCSHFSFLGVSGAQLLASVSKKSLSPLDSMCNIHALLLQPLFSGRSFLAGMFLQSSRGH